jgi:hypothetical protein
VRSDNGTDGNHPRHHSGNALDHASELRAFFLIVDMVHDSINEPLGLDIGLERRDNLGERFALGTNLGEHLGLAVCDRENRANLQKRAEKCLCATHAPATTEVLERIRHEEEPRALDHRLNGGDYLGGTTACLGGPTPGKRREAKLHAIRA